VISFHAISSNEDCEWAEKKCVEQINKISNFNSEITFTAKADSLNLLQEVKGLIQKNAVDLTFMATHGKKDLQFITGSNALKLVFNAEAPTIVVQQNTKLKPYKHIMLPVSILKEEMEFHLPILQHIINLFNAKLTLFVPATKDDKEEAQLQLKVDAIKHTLKLNNESMLIKKSNQSNKKFEKEFLAYAKEQRVDLIAVVVDVKHNRANAEKGKKFLQEMITNETGIPVLCL
jgi:hypothetical protein